MISRRSLSFDGKLFFLYDREAVKSESDPPENAIIYFYPTSATIENRISICGQLVGMSNFLSSVLDFAPVMVTLRTEKVALYQSGKYTLALGGSINEPETLLLKQLQTLFNVFVFYHGSLDAVCKLSKDHASFLSNMSIIWDCYLHFIRHYGDTLPAVFNPLPFFKAPKCVVYSTRDKHYKKTSVAKTKPITYIKLPFGVRFLDSFVTCCEYHRLITALQKSPYHGTIKSTRCTSRRRAKYPKQTDNVKDLKYENCEHSATKPRIENDNTNKSNLEKQQLIVDVLPSSPPTFSESLDFIDDTENYPRLAELEELHASSSNLDVKVMVDDSVLEKGLQDDRTSELAFDKGASDSIHITSGNELQSDGFEVCLGTLPIDADLTMDEIDIAELYIINKSERESISSTLDQNIDDTCKDVLNSLVEQVVKNCENLSENIPKDSGLNGKYFEKSNSTELTVDTTSNGSSLQSSKNEGKDHSPNGIVYVKKEVDEDDLVCDCATDDYKASKTQTDYLPFNITNTSSLEETTTFTSHRSISTDPTPTESIHSPIEEFHDTVEDLSIEEELTFTEKTVNDFLHTYNNDLKHCGLSTSKYSDKNLNHSANKTVEKNFFKDLVATEDLSAGSVKEQNEPSLEEQVSGSKLSYVSSGPSSLISVKNRNSLGDLGLNGSIHSLPGNSPNSSCVHCMDSQPDISGENELNSEVESKQEEKAKYVNKFDQSLYEIDGLVHVNLYVQAHSNTVLILLAESSLSEDHETIKALWKTSLNQLGELEVLLDQCGKNATDNVDRPDDYGFVVYDAISCTTKGNLSEPVEQSDFKFCDMAKSVHEQFNNCTTLKSVTLSGVSSVVRRCLHRTTGCEYAVKIIDKLSDQGGVDIVDTTKDEVDILLSVHGHQSVIGLVDVFESSAFFFLVFEFASNGELFDYLTQQVTLSEKKARKIMKQILDAVAFMHEKGIVHRDLKPENILLDQDFNVKLSDFGFAMILEEGELLKELCGTPGYLAPEVLQCSMFPDAPGYNKKVDMWACGVILYTLLCGFPPFWHRRQVVMIRSIMQGKYQFNSPDWDEISNNAKDLISKMLVVHPQMRISASQSLDHPWFVEAQSQKISKFCARWKFKGAVIAIIAAKEFERLMQSKLLPMSFDMVCQEPYSNKPIRKLIDGCAYRIYGHWVKRNKDANQNRAALFENKLNKERYNTTDGNPHGKRTLPLEASFRLLSFRSTRKLPSKSN